MMWLRSLLLLTLFALAGVARAEPSLCGDVDGDGYWRDADVTRFREALAGSGGALSIDEELRCNAAIDDSLPGASTISAAFDNDCTVLDVAILRRAIAGHWPEPAEICPAGSRGDCCTSNAGPGCSSPEVAACVCQTLPECCAAQWTAACASAAAAPACASASPGVEACDLDGNTAATQTWLSGSVFQTGAGEWWSTAYHRRVFMADVDADARADLVGVATNGDVWVATSTGGGFSAASLWRAATVFSVANGWWSTGVRERVWLADVTGDGAADLLGVANNGDLWAAESTGSDFNATHLVAGSVFTTPAYFTLADQPRIFVGDVNADGKADVVGISAAGDVFVARATGSGASAGFAASSTAWLVSSVFKVATEWFETASRARVFLADVTGDGAADLLGVAKNGDLWVSEARPNTLDFRASHLVAPSRLMTTTDVTTSFFSLLRRPQIFLGDVTADGKVDLVGIAPPGVGDGDVWLERATGSGTSAGFSERVALRESVFRANFGWFDLTHQERVFLADVTGDARADLVGLANNGDVWVARSAEEVGSASAPPATQGPRTFFQPSERFGESLLSSANGFLSTATHPRLFVPDVTGDDVRDLVGVASGAGSVADGDVLHRMAAATRITGETALTREMIESGVPQQYILQFSRGIDPASVPSAALRVRQNGAAITPVAVVVGGKQAIWTLTFDPTGGAPTHVEIELSSQVLDRSLHRIDADGDGRIGGIFARRREWSESLLVGQATVDLTTYPFMAGLPAPSGYGYCPAGIDTVLPRGNPPHARVLVLAGGGACSADLDCRGDQTCVASVCREPDGTDADDPFALVSVDQVGFNPGRARDLIVARTGIARERIVIAATHAHWTVRNIRLFVAPYYDDRYSNSFDLPYQSWVEDRIADTVAEAARGLLPAEIDVASGILPLGFNRRGSSIPVDHETRVARFRVAGGRVRAAIVNHAVHPVAISSGAGLDADFPGYMAQDFEALNCPSGGCTALFVNGGAGDINPVDAATSTGAQLADFAVTAPAAFAPTDGMQIAIERQIRAFAQGISSCHNCGPEPVHNDGLPTTWDAEATAARIGVPGATSPVLVFGTLPGEPFIQLQWRLRANPTSALLFGYTDGYLGYLPDDSAFGDGHGLYGVEPCADSLGSYPNGPSFFSNATHTPGETLVDGMLDAINNRLGD